MSDLVVSSLGVTTPTVRGLTRLVIGVKEHRMKGGTMNATKYELKADDVTMWSGESHPTNAQALRAANRADDRGWSGTFLDLYEDGKLIDHIQPACAQWKDFS
jgi:hypothetical protein